MMSSKISNGKRSRHARRLDIALKELVTEQERIEVASSEKCVRIFEKEV